MWAPERLPAFAPEHQRQRIGGTVKRFRGGLVFKAHRLLYHPTLGSRVIKKKKKYLEILEEEKEHVIAVPARTMPQRIRTPNPYRGTSLIRNSAPLGRTLQ